MTALSTQLVKKSFLNLQDKLDIRAIWNSEYPHSVRFTEIEGLEKYLAGLSDITHYLVYSDKGVAGWLPVFTREGERWFALLVRSDFQRKGLGKQLLDHARKSERVLNGWVVDKAGFVKSNGQEYRSPLSFYLNNGFDVIPEVRLETEQLSFVKIRWSAV
ncbi:MAG TPA: hypothetical protein DCG19_10120 [Cryomorphaceae bacterium]|nr:hypothetical protein [Owenweeksia sp.]MBF99788.1 hypothetical protein [Owenweeksia sp.]HAD97751.1 hypothetical protein [Cryomorphaceae bacterium]HBF19230.1 hypothetical protein [Cryomorphaceae bacterium]HCQ15525.1 hypothetical protein [Cryomorphaceae bacterium]